MEYCSNGKLLTYLRNHRSDRTYYNCNNYSNCNNNSNSSVERKTREREDQDEVKKTLSSRDLISFAYQIVKGMEFISSHGVSVKCNIIILYYSFDIK